MFGTRYAARLVVTYPGNSALIAANLLDELLAELELGKIEIVMRRLHDGCHDARADRLVDVVLPHARVGLWTGRADELAHLLARILDQLDVGLWGCGSR